MGIGQIFSEFSWGALMALPPSEFLSLVLLILLVPFLFFWFMFNVVQVSG